MQRAPNPAVSDEQLLRMLSQVEDVEEAVLRELDRVEEVPAPEESPFDPCGFCGEPAQYRGECTMCEDEGCLPADLWSPGMADPCLTACVRCARGVHLACSAQDEAGNPCCPTCSY